MQLLHLSKTGTLSGETLSGEIFVGRNYSSGETIRRAKISSLSKKFVTFARKISPDKISCFPLPTNLINFSTRLRIYGEIGTTSFQLPTCLFSKIDANFFRAPSCSICLGARYDGGVLKEWNTEIGPFSRRN